MEQKTTESVAPMTTGKSRQRPPLSNPEIQRLYRNSPEMHKDVKSLAAFGRLVKLVEAVHFVG